MSNEASNDAGLSILPRFSVRTYSAQHSIFVYVCMKKTQRLKGASERRG